jgi:hypothetical protein
MGPAYPAPPSGPPIPAAPGRPPGGAGPRPPARPAPPASPAPAPGPPPAQHDAVPPLVQPPAAAPPAAAAADPAGGLEGRPRPDAPGPDFPDTVAPEVRRHPAYAAARARLIQPDQVRVQSAYFWKKWVPLLGPDLAVLIVQLRNMCYYNPATGERRDWCFPSQATLAAAIGVKNTHTIANLLKRPYADLFVRVEERYRYDPLRRKKVQTTSLYHVRMDDPLTPEDAARLAAELSAAGATAAAAPGASAGIESAGQDPPGTAAEPAGAPDLTRNFRVRSPAPDAKLSRRYAREDFASESARNFRDEEGLLRESIEDKRAAQPPVEDSAGSMWTTETVQRPAPAAARGRGTAPPAPARGQPAQSGAPAGGAGGQQAPAPGWDVRPAAAALARAQARAILARREGQTAHRLRGEPALGASEPVRLNAALEEVRRRLFGVPPSPQACAADGPAGETAAPGRAPPDVGGWRRW